MSIPSQTAPCPTCGRMMHVAMPACQNCGNDPRTGRNLVTTSPKILSLKSQVIIIVVAVVVICSFFTYVFMMSRDTRSGNINQSQSPRGDRPSSRLTMEQFISSVQIGENMSDVISVFGSPDPPNEYEYSYFYKCLDGTVRLRTNLDHQVILYAQFPSQNS